MKATTKFIEEFRNKWEGANATTGVISTLMMDRMEEDLKDILTKHEEAVVERIEKDIRGYLELRPNSNTIICERIGAEGTVREILSTLKPTPDNSTSDKVTP